MSQQMKVAFQNNKYLQNNFGLNNAMLSIYTRMVAYMLYK